MLIFVKNDDCVSYKMIFHHVFIYYSCPGHRPWARVIICVVFFFFYLCPGHRPWAQVIICVGFFFFYLRPGHRPRAQVIICVGFFFTCAQAIGRGTSHNLRRVFFFFFFCIIFPPLENGQIAQ